MRIDQKAITPSEARHLNAALDAAWGNPHAIITQCRDVFLELCRGSDSVELLVGGETLHVHDRRGKTPVYLEECLTDSEGLVVRRRVTDVADAAIYREASILSPLDRIPCDSDQQLIITALQLAAAESRQYGHHTQADKFSQLWEEFK